MIYGKTFKFVADKLHLLRLIIKCKHIKKTKILGRFKSPGTNPTGLSYDGKYLWHCDANYGILYKIHPKTKEIIYSQKLPFSHPWGLTWDGEFLWISDDLERRIYKIDLNGNVIQYFRYRNMDIHGLAWDGENIWFVDWISKRINKINPKNGKIIDKILAPSKNPAGLHYHDGALWHTDSDLNIIYKILPEGKVEIYRGFKGHQHDVCMLNDHLLLVSVRNLKCIYEVEI